MTTSDQLAPERAGTVGMTASQPVKRILFVDDEPWVLEGLRRTMRPHSHQWQTAAVTDGETALKLLDREPFDVIVSELRMPGMDGATLLREVQKSFPNVARIVLSGFTEFKNVLRTEPAAHQFLAKPCDPDMLLMAVERACSLKAILNDEATRRVVGSLGDIPSLPQTYAALTQAVCDPDVSISQIAGIVEHDVGLSAKVLQVVNSAFFGLARQIGTIKTAVAYLGTDVLRHLVLSVELFRAFAPGEPIEGFSLERLQSHSYLAFKIVGQLPIPRRLAEPSATGALLHDAGQLVLAARLPGYFARTIQAARQQSRPLHTVEQELNGLTHAEIGAYLLGLWGLSSPILETVAHHHAPMRVRHHEFDGVLAVYVADVLAHQHSGMRSDGADLAEPTLDESFLDTLGLTEQLPAWHEMAEETAQALAANGF